MAAMDSIASKFAEYETTIKLLTAKLQGLADENESLRSGLGAHGVLKLVYSDNNQPAGVRVKAAQAALNVEKPRLAPVEAPLDLVAEEIEPLQDVLARQRARADRLMALSLEERSALITGVVRNGGNGSDSDASSGSD
jgi:hypothetical protein